MLKVQKQEFKGGSQAFYKVGFFCGHRVSS